MEDKLKQARFALMTMFEVIEEDIVEMKSRKQNKVHARMFYNYYLHHQVQNPLQTFEHYPFC